ncbi:MAG: biotin/lipoyl-containing protein [Gammaproteobacteria bacterium]
MSLTAADVAEIMRLVEESSFDELTLEMEGVKLSLRRGGGSGGGGGGGLERSDAFDESASAAPSTTTTTATAIAAAQGAAKGGASAPTAPSVPHTPAVKPSTDPSLHDVNSPLLGTFYRAPKPGAPAFVEVGATVEPDTIIGIIEVMKLMNTVRADVAGVVTEIYASDGALVEYEQTLLRIRKKS